MSIGPALSSIGIDRRRLDVIGQYSLLPTLFPTILIFAHLSFNRIPGKYTLFAQALPDGPESAKEQMQRTTSLMETFSAYLFQRQSNPRFCRLHCNAISWTSYVPTVRHVLHLMFIFDDRVAEESLYWSQPATLEMNWTHGRGTVCYYLRDEGNKKKRKS
ncbi:hypothetical protein FRC18_008026 [Serendipita sp. 400]|nr:hypothetical protein FRC18_008026 [Serendipita sp. 400]